MGAIRKSPETPARAVERRTSSSCTLGRGVAMAAADQVGRRGETGWARRSANRRKPLQGPRRDQAELPSKTSMRSAGPPFWCGASDSRRGLVHGYDLGHAGSGRRRRLQVIGIVVIAVSERHGRLSASGFQEDFDSCGCARCPGNRPPPGDGPSTSTARATRTRAGADLHPRTSGDSPRSRRRRECRSVTRSAFAWLRPGSSRRRNLPSACMNGASPSAAD